MTFVSEDHTIQYVTRACGRCGEDLLQTLPHVCKPMDEAARAVWIIAVIIAARDVVIGGKIKIWDDLDLDFFEEWERQLFSDPR